MNPNMKGLRQEYAGKKVLIVGLGLLGGGAGLVRFFAALGAQVRATDLRSEKELQEMLISLSEVSFGKTLGGHKEEDFLWADVIFKGPSVPWDLPELQGAVKKGIPIEMELSFFSSLCSARIVGVTGTRGKSTTATMIFEILKAAGHNVYLGGNIQNTSTVNLLHKVTDKSIVVLELSSWALSGFHQKKLSPSCAVFTNFYDDHLNYYKTKEAYLWDKKAIYLYQNERDVLVINKNFLQIPKPDNYRGKLIAYEASDFQGTLRLRGEHNKENAAAAHAVAKEVFTCDEDVIKTVLSNFKGLPARLEIIGEKDGIQFINDGTATTPIATEKALFTLSDKPVILIMGGNSKNLPIGDLITSLESVSRIYLLQGTLTDILKKNLNNSSKVAGEFPTLDEAVSKAYEEGKKLGNCYILFSPAATSFAQFKNEFDRAGQFNTIVKKLLHE